ncbi:hypothetical protein TL16_g09866 [Triparma laevis f. inornata]|uniref:Leucine-rich repeat domain-containing protein n=1 Tax=Triparma laevis f. inornata TaxID=1714386 RepID=A0A9W7BDP3_9STRA|nr:hypothetical protein TL16_g09866 [Triparma laevis f. inornata]
MFTEDFKRLLIGLVQGDTLMTLRLATKTWKRVADEFIDEGVKSGKFLVHEGIDISEDVEYVELEEWNKLVTRVIFLLNITKIGKLACVYAHNLVVVDIPEGVKSIGECAFSRCSSLATVSFPTTLISIGNSAFVECTGLETVDLLHTNLKEIGEMAFSFCSELKSMTIPDSLQTFGEFVFLNCSKLVPSSIDVSYDSDEDDNDDGFEDSTSEVVDYIRARMQIAEKAALKQQLTDQGKQITDQGTQIASLKTQVEQQTTQIANQGTQIASLKTQLAEQGTEILSAISALKSKIASKN